MRVAPVSTISWLPLRNPTASSLQQVVAPSYAAFVKCFTLGIWLSCIFSLSWLFPCSFSHRLTGEGWCRFGSCIAWLLCRTFCYRGQKHSILTSSHPPLQSSGAQPLVTVTRFYFLLFTDENKATKPNKLIDQQKLLQKMLPVYETYLHLTRREWVANGLKFVFSDQKAATFRLYKRDCMVFNGFRWSITHSLIRSLARSINQSINQLISQSVKQAITQSINQSINQSIVYLYT